MVWMCMLPLTYIQGHCMHLTQHHSQLYTCMHNNNNKHTTVSFTNCSKEHNLMP